jgi:hypothetical protein
VTQFPITKALSTLAAGNGTVTVFATGDELKIIAKNDLEEQIVAHYRIIAEIGDRSRGDAL